MGSEAIFWLGKFRMDPVGSRQVPVADSHIYGDETSGSGATKRVSPVKCWVRCQAKTERRSCNHEFSGRAFRTT
jgi:hypothetical protein